jgi:hypothetical protein
MEPTIEPIEAVIITGPRKGQIIQLPDRAGCTISDAEIKLLNLALDELIAAFDRLIAEVRATNKAFPRG